MMVHWTSIVFAVIVVLIILKIISETNKPRGDYGFDLISPFLLIILIAFILIWGGIFWW